MKEYARTLINEQHTTTEWREKLNEIHDARSHGGSGRGA